MGYNSELDGIAEGIATVLEELLEDNIHWQLADFEQEGFDYNFLCEVVTELTITKMYNKLQNKHDC